MPNCAKCGSFFALGDRPRCYCRDINHVTGYCEGCRKNPCICKGDGNFEWSVIKEKLSYGTHKEDTDFVRHRLVKQAFGNSRGDEFEQQLILADLAIKNCSSFDAAVRSIQRNFENVKKNRMLEFD